MRKKDELNILPSKYYVGQLVDWRKFFELSGNTEYLLNNLNFFVRDSMEILYSLNAINDRRPNIDAANEIQVLGVPIAAENIAEKTWKNLITAMQRGVPYNILIIFIFRNEEYRYKVAVTDSHQGKRAEITVVDAAYSTEWMDLTRLKDFFVEHKESLQNPTVVFLDAFWNNVVEEVKCRHNHRVKYLVDFGFSWNSYNNTEGITVLVGIIGEEEMERLLYYDFDRSKAFQYEDIDENIEENIEIESDEEKFKHLVIAILQAKLIPDNEVEKISNWMSGLQKGDIIGLFEEYREGVYIFDDY